MVAKTVFSIILFFLCLGVGLIVLINRKNSRQKQKELWLKLGVYILLVLLITSSLLFNFGFLGIASSIICIGLYEIIKISKKSKPQSKLLGIIIYGFLGYAFLRFAWQTPNNQKLFVYVLVLIFDGFSQLSGQLLGKHHPFKVISPNKTSEGIFGGFLALLATAYLMKYVIEVSYPDLIIMALIIGITALLGDLLASFYKRICGVKDFSQIIPGHGGVLDRFDSFIFAGGAYWLIY